MAPHVAYPLLDVLNQRKMILKTNFGYLRLQFILQKSIICEKILHFFLMYLQFELKELRRRKEEEEERERQRQEDLAKQATLPLSDTKDKYD